MAHGITSLIDAVSKLKCRMLNNSSKNIQTKSVTRFMSQFLVLRLFDNNNNQNKSRNVCVSTEGFGEGGIHFEISEKTLMTRAELCILWWLCILCRWHWHYQSHYGIIKDRLCSHSKDFHYVKMFHRCRDKSWMLRNEWKFTVGMKFTISSFNNVPNIFSLIMSVPLLNTSLLQLIQMSRIHFDVRWSTYVCYA